MACVSSSSTHRTRTPVQLATTSVDDSIALDVGQGKNFNIEIKHTTTAAHILLVSNPKPGRRGTIIITNTSGSDVNVTLDLSALVTITYSSTPILVAANKHVLCRYYFNSEGTPLATAMHVEVVHEP